MKVFFIFFLRLFFCLVAAKFILQVLGLDNRIYLIALTLIFTGNLYWFDYLEYRDRISLRLRKKQKTPAGPAAAPEEIPTPPSDN